MISSLRFLLPLLLLPVLSSCYSTPPPAATAPAAAPTPITGAAINTEEEARTAVARYVLQQPNAALYQLDSARVLALETQWQVLVPRTDWAGRMPDKAAFTVDKTTGGVTVLSVK